MTEINLPQELMDRAIEAMLSKLIEDGYNYTLRNAVEERLKERLLESGVVDTLVDGIVNRIITDKDAIIAAAGDSIISGIGEALAQGYKEAAKTIVDSMKNRRF